MASRVQAPGSLNFGGDERDSAKQRRRNEYKQDLELQIREKNAARTRERLQEMNVNASGFLDPEKRADRFKPLGGVHWLDQREKRGAGRVQPYHTLFLYDKDQPSKLSHEPVTPEHKHFAYRSLPIRRTARRFPSEPRMPEGAPVRVVDEAVPVEPLLLRQRRLLGDNPVGIHYQPATYASAGVQADQTYNLFNVHDYGGGGGGGGGSIVQPISLPHGENRPIIVQAQHGCDRYQAPRFNPFDARPVKPSTDYQSLLLMTQSEKDRMRRENEEFQRRLRQDMENEKRKLNEQEVEARRRLEELRRQAEERRKEAERDRREAERLKKEAATRPKTDPVQRPSSKKVLLYSDMNEYRLRLIEERKKIEELLKAGKPVDEAWDLRVVRKPPRNIPPTPKSADRANREVVNDFNNLKYRDFMTRDQFRNVYPDVPLTNKRLELQQDALIRQQEAQLRENRRHRPTQHIWLPPRAVSRPSWLDRDPTPFPHVLRQRDRLYTSRSEGDLDRIRRRNTERERVLDAPGLNEEAALDELKIRHQRPSSTDTLADDTWLRPSSRAEI